MYNHYTTQRPKCQALILNEEWQKISDSAPTPLVKKVTYYKYANRRIIAALNQIGEPNKAAALYGCGTYIRTGKRNGHEVITESNFCRQRLCQVCAWRRSAKFTAQMIPVIRNLQAKGYKALFLTLTVANPTADNVSNALDVLLKGWDRLLKLRKYKRIIKGFVRALEVTYNATENTYHPHIHALWFVHQSYGESGKDYISFEELREDWKNAARLDYNPLVRIQAVKPKKKHIKSTDQTNTAAVVETLKYCYKVDQKHISAETIATLLYSLNGRRLISFGGVVAEERKALQQGDIDDNLNEQTTEVDNEYDVLYIFSPSGWRIIEGI